MTPKDKAVREALRQSADYLRSLPVDGVRTQEAKQFAAQNEAAITLLDAETQARPSRDDLVKVREALSLLTERKTAYSEEAFKSGIKSLNILNRLLSEPGKMGVE